MSLRALIALLLVAVCTTSALAADEAALRTHIAALSGGDRSAGSAGARASADYIAAEATRATGQPVFRQSFLLALPAVERCTAVDADGGNIPLSPLIPSGSQGAAIAPGDGRSDVLYVGQGTLAELRGKDLAKKIVVMEIISDATAWKTVAALGARAIVFLGDEKTTTFELLNKSTDIPVGIPRFYCDDGEAAARLRSGEVKSLSIDVLVRWQERRLENVFCFLPGTVLPDKYIVLQSRLDGSSQVMGRASGATCAASAGALLELGRKVSRSPAHTSVLLLWTSGDEWNLRGTRAALELLGADQRDGKAALAELDRRLSAAGARLDLATRVELGLTRISESAGFDLSASGEVRRALADELLRQSSRIEDALQQTRLQSPDNVELLESLQRKKEELRDANAALGSKSAGDWRHPRILDAAKSLLPRWRTESTRAGELKSSLATWPAIRSRVGDLSPSLPMLFASVAITGGTPRYGFFSRSHYSPLLDQTGKMSSFAFRRYAKPPLGVQLEGFVSESQEVPYTLESFFSTKLAFSSDAALMRGIPAGAFATVQDPLDFFDTPNDTADRLNVSNIARQVQLLEGLLVGTRAAPGAFADADFFRRTQLPSFIASQDVTLYERALGESLPQLRAAHCLIGGQAESGNRALVPLAGTRRFDWHLTGVDGLARFESSFRGDYVRTQLQACEFDDAGLPLRTLAGNQADVGGMVSEFYADPDRPVRALIFESRRLDCYGLFDPRYLDTLDRIDVYDARRTDRAQYSQVYAANGMAAVFMQPNLRWQLLVAKGALTNRMLLINADADHPTGVGFDTTDLSAIGPLGWRNDLDLAALNGRRQGDLQKFGISNEVIKDLQAAAREQLDSGRKAKDARDYPAFFAAANAAWSLQSQVYENLIDTSNGIIKGVIFLLLGIVPFSYFLERLLIGSPNVYRQIGGFAAIFAMMTAALWFHPAFRISSAPLMILLAFLILILSSAVVYILWGKFEEEIAILRGAGGVGGEAHSTSLRRAAVLGAAIRLGLSNMRRRGTRTALTLLTLVLLTFTLLCFTSVRETVQVTPRAVDFPGGMSMPPSSVLLRQRAWASLPAEVQTLARELTLPESGPIARRWWYASERLEQSWSLPVRSRVTGEVFSAHSLLGLDAAEAAFQAVDIETVLPGFSKLGETPDLCWLPIEAKKAGSLAVGDTVEILGHPLTVAGFFDDGSFRKLRQLTGDPLSPMQPGGGSSSAAPVNPNRPAPEASYRFLQSANVAVVPGHFVERIGGRLTSVVLRPCVPSEKMLEFAEGLARRSAFSIYVSDGTRVRSINAAAGSQPRDFAAVITPMVIAGIIILNTMLGAVAERTREIHVYTSIGLAPSHVGMLFLAEAAALGTIGVVSGYIFGQGLATVLTWTHLLPGVDLNYSSLSAIVTMGLVLGIVMLSALWPARAATRVAAPSLQREWKLPQPVGDVLSVELPFTVNESAAKGVCAFLEEFFVTSTQTGSAHFTADNIHGTLHSDISGEIVRGLRARIWLAPYDLGVIELIRLTIHGTPQHNIYEVRLEIIREAGNPGTWRRLNRPFLTEIRKQFLLWRNLTPEQVKHYVEQSERLFARAPRP